MKFTILFNLLSTIALSLSLHSIANADDFRIDPASPGYPDDYYSASQVVDCSSSGYKYNTCAVSGRPYSIRLLNQVSRSACVEGDSFGITDSAVWVDKGCRGSFEVFMSYGHGGHGDHGGGGHGGGHHGGGHGGYREDVTITCSSSGYRYQTCDAGGYIERAYLASQLSRSSCQEGVSWGYTQNYIWVDKGCRANFQVTINRR